MPNEPLIAFIAEFLKVFGRGIRVKVEIEGKGSLILTFPGQAQDAGQKA